MFLNFPHRNIFEEDDMYKELEQCLRKIDGREGHRVPDWIYAAANDYNGTSLEGLLSYCDTLEGHRVPDWMLAYLKE
jgi:hypothetical protein